MLKWLYPNLYIDSTYHIDFKKYREEGYRAVIFDIDNTLVEHGEPATDKVIRFFTDLKEMGYDFMVMSNNKEDRVKNFAAQIGDVGYIYKANKPFKASYLKCMKEMGSDCTDTLFVGDQLFTDVLGAKNLKIFSILVEPIDKKEEIQIVIKRYLEKIVLYFYKRYIKRQK